MERGWGQLWLKMSSQIALKDEKGGWIWNSPPPKKKKGMASSCPSITHHRQVTCVYALAEMHGQEHTGSHSLPLQGQWIQALTPLSHSFYFICIFPDLHWKIQVELGTFSATDGLITPVKIFSLSHTQMKSKIRLSVGIIKTGTGKKDRAHGKAFQIDAAFKSCWTLFLNASVLLYESSLHPKQGQSSRKQAFVSLSLLSPLFSYTFLYYWTSFLSLPMNFFGFVLVLPPPLFFSCSMPQLFLSH